MNQDSQILSIIIPVYNAAQTIERCVNSILLSTVDKSQYEIFLINDGSQDKSLEICHRMKMSNENIKIFSHANAGTSTTRNVGLENAIGEYVWFIDADDYIETSFLEQLIGFIELHPKYDLISFDYLKSGEVKQDVFKDNVVTGIAFLKDNNRLFLWNHIYKKKAIGTNRFLDGTKNIEDWLFNIMVLVQSKSILHLPIVGYNYCEDNNTSTSRSRSRANLEKLSKDSIDIHTALLRFSKSLQVEEQKKVVLEALNFSVIGHLYSLFKYYDVNNFKQAIDLYKKMGLFPTQRTNNKRANLFRMLVNHQNLAILAMRFWQIVT